MDANTVRIILFIVGILVIVGIYLFDRARKRRAAAPPEPRRDAGADAPPLDGDSLIDDLEINAYREPLSDDELRAADDLAPPVETEAPARPGPVSEAPPQPPPAAADLPTLIVQIHIIAREGREFPGERIFSAAREVALEHGEMGIFHRMQGDEILFSMANLVEPGTFDPDHARGFSTPGLALFTQLPVAKDGLAVFSDMLFTAERLASELGGELYDENHGRLSKQTIGHIRDRILEHRRQVQMAMR